MVPACRRNRLGGVGWAAAKIILSVGADAEICCVPIKPSFDTGLECVSRKNIRDVLASLEQIAVNLYHRPTGAVESFKKSVVEFDSRVSEVLGWKARSRASQADGRFKYQL